MSEYFFGADNNNNSAKNLALLQPLEHNTYKKRLRIKIRNLAVDVTAWLENEYNIHGVPLIERIISGEDAYINFNEGEVIVFSKYRNRTYVIAKHSLRYDTPLLVIHDVNQPPDTSLALATKKELAYLAMYHRMHNKPYLSYYDPTEGARPKPKFFMWPATEVGEVHKIHSPHGYWLD